MEVNLTVAPSRLAKLARGMNCDNLVNNARGADYTLDELCKLRSMGITYVRVPWEVSRMIAGTPFDWDPYISTQADVDLAVSRLDAFMAMCWTANLAVALCPFVSRAVYDLGVPQSQAIILQAVDFMSARYNQTAYAWRLFFEVLNEPYYDNPTWNAFAPQLVAAIRKNAPAHTVIVSPASWALASNFSDLTPMADQNIVYSMHVYAPAQLTGQGARVAPIDPDYVFPAPPGTLGSTGLFTATKLDDYIQVGVDWASAHNVPLIVGEFGATNVGPHDARMAWIKQVRAKAEASCIGWAWWAYDGRLFGINPHGLGYDPDLVSWLGK